MCYSPRDTSRLGRFVLLLGLVLVAACGESDGAEVPDGGGPPVSHDRQPSQGPEPSPTTEGPAALPQTYTVDSALAQSARGGEVGARIGQLMDAEAEQLKGHLVGLKVERIAEGIKVTLDVGIPFEEGSDDLAPETMDYLSRLAARLAEFDQADVIVVGHTDGTGVAEENLRLSERRALAAVTYLASEGVDPVRLSHVGRGQLEPVVLDGGNDESALRENRRVEVGIFASDRMEASAGAGSGATQ